MEKKGEEKYKWRHILWKKKIAMAELVIVGTALE